MAVLTKWAVDPTHTEVQFKVKHLVISTVTGAFNEFSGSVETETDDFDGATVSFEAKTASVDTNNDDRDNHLRSADFFDSEKFPNLSFTGKLAKSGSDYTLKGDLTVKDVTKPIDLDVEFGGIADDPWGNTKAGFEISGKINRKIFGLTWNTVTEAGGVLVGEDVKLSINAQLGVA